MGPLIFALCLFFLSLSGFNLYCWKGIHFSWSLDLVFICLFFILISNFWYRDLLREFYKKYETLFMVLFLLFFLFLFSEALLFISFFWASFHSLSSPTFGGWTGFYCPDPCELTFHYSLSYWVSHLLVYKSKNLGSWVYRLMIQFIVLSSFFLLDYISFIFSLAFFF